MTRIFTWLLTSNITKGPFDMFDGLWSTPRHSSILVYYLLNCIILIQYLINICDSYVTELMVRGAFTMPIFLAWISILIHFDQWNVKLKLYSYRNLCINTLLFLMTSIHEMSTNMQSEEEKRPLREGGIHGVTAHFSFAFRAEWSYLRLWESNQCRRKMLKFYCWLQWACSRLAVLRGKFWSAKFIGTRDLF